MRRYRLRVPGPCGPIETVITDPADLRRGIALIAHPHPLHGGSLDNKVTTTIARALSQRGLICVRPNFRGVGASAGEYAHGRGEAEDMCAVHRFIKARFDALPLLLAGFSFGAYVQAQIARDVGAQQLILVAPALNLFSFDALAVPARVIHGARDELVPPALVEAWSRAHAIPCELIPGADHYFHRHLNRLSEAVVAACPF